MALWRRRDIIRTFLSLGLIQFGFLHNFLESFFLRHRNCVIVDCVQPFVSLGLKLELALGVELVLRDEEKVGWEIERGLGGDAVKSLPEGGDSELEHYFNVGESLLLNYGQSVHTVLFSSDHLVHL